MSYNYNDKEKNPPDLLSVLQNLQDDIFKTLNCIQIGQIEAFDSTTQTASISLVVKKTLSKDTDGTVQYGEYPVLLECPVVILGGGDARITFPITIGDTCVVMFNDREIDNWFYDGEKRATTTHRRHDLSDAIALVGIRNVVNAYTDYVTDGVDLRLNATNYFRILADNIIMNRNGKYVKITASNIEINHGDKIIVGGGAINSTTALFTQSGNMAITGNTTISGGLTVIGDVVGSGGGSMNFNTNITQTGGKSIEAGNGATGTFTTVDGKTVTVTKGIIVSII